MCLCVSDKNQGGQEKEKEGGSIELRTIYIEVFDFDIWCWALLGGVCVGL